MDSERFQQLVEEALEELPQQFAERLDNVAVIVADLATPAQLASVSVRNSHHLLGDRKSTRLNSSHIPLSRMPSSA